jgi:YVTN family beta-propeller protein
MVEFRHPCEGRDPFFEIFAIIPINKLLPIAIVSVLSMQSIVVSQSNLKSVISPELVFETLALNKDIPTPAKPKYLSPTDIVASPDKSKLYVAEQTAKQIDVIAIESKSVIQTIMLPNEVTGVTVSKDGSKLYATITSEIWPEGYVCAINAETGKIEQKIKVGHSPRSPVLSPDGTTLYVCNQFNNNISVVDIASGKETKIIKVNREPYCARITPDGSVLVVANSLPLANATDSTAAHCTVSLIDLRDESKTVHIGLTQGSLSAFGICIIPDGSYAFITHLVAMNNFPATQIKGGWVHTNNLAIIDLKNRKYVNDISLDYSKDTGCANPWDVECTPDGKFVVVAHAGSNEISIIDLPQMVKIADTTAWLAHKIDLLNPQTIRKRVTIEGKQPRALTIVDDEAYVTDYFSNTVEVFDINLSPSEFVEKFSLGNEQSMTLERKGEYHFCCGDKLHCQGAWQSCQSCHPNARADGLDWMLAAGVTMQKNTKSMVYSWWTPPACWTQRHTYEYPLSNAIIQELGIIPIDSIKNFMEEYLKRIKPLPSPHLTKGRFNESALRGREVFYNDKTDCKKCHPAPLFTDLKLHTSIVADQWDASTNFDTPSILEAWRTSPWDHIGTTTDFETLLTNSRHSNCASKLTESELRDLMEYVLSL